MASDVALKDPNIRPVRRTSAQASALYDVPGPRARRILWASSAAAAVAILAAAWLLVVRPLDEQGQFSYELWGPIIDPAHEFFRPLWTRIGQGLSATLQAAALAILTSSLCGIALAVLRVQLKKVTQHRYVGLPSLVAWSARRLSWVLNGLTRVCVDVLRGMPVVITIFFVARGLPEYGVRLDNVVWYLVIGLTAYNMVVIAEIVRSGMEGLPKGQTEAAASLGLSSLQTTVLVLLPQSVRIMLPALIGQLVVVLKDTSLGFIISYEELLNVTKTATLVLSNPIQMYFLVAIIYLMFNYALSRLADWTQNRLSRART